MERTQVTPTLAAITLRRATAADAPAMWAVRAAAIRQTCRSHYPAEMLERWASSPLPDSFPSRIESEYFVVATIESRIVGFAGIKAASAEVEAVFVAPDTGRHGLGRSLMADLEIAALEAGIESLSLSSSLNAVPFYRALGYSAGAQKIYTTSQGLEIACVIMQKQLVASAD